MYSTGCPKCDVLKKKLDTKGYKYEIVNDTDTIQKVGEENNINTLPILNVDDNIMDFKGAVKWLEEDGQ